LPISPFKAIAIERHDGQSVHWQLQAMAPTSCRYVQVNAKIQARPGQGNGVQVVVRTPLNRVDVRPSGIDGGRERAGDSAVQSGLRPLICKRGRSNDNRHGCEG
jgi:hypothetical protein